MQADFQGVYLHIPFCLEKCFYCDFPSYAGKLALIDAYVDALCAEIAGASCLSRPKTVYFGGGTPSLLTAEQMQKIVQALETTGWWGGEQERSLEANPGTVDLAKLQAFLALGFNRLSLGVQSFEEKVLKNIGRIHDAAQAEQAVQLAKRAGFKNINLDLMYGLPGQTLVDLQTSVDKALALGAAHLSVYGLVVEEETKLEQMLAEKILTLPEDQEEEMYDFVTACLPLKNYQRYEISNYALPGFACRHNIIYWQYRPYQAFGVAACSFDGRQRKTNTFSLEEYLLAFGQKSQVPAETEKLDEQTQMAEFVFMGLRMTEGVNRTAFWKRFNADIFMVYPGQLKEHLSKGWLEITKEYVKLTSEGMKVGNKIFLTFLPLTY